MVIMQYSIMNSTRVRSSSPIISHSGTWEDVKDGFSLIGFIRFKIPFYLIDPKVELPGRVIFEKNMIKTCI